jgi:hypothetical protein
LEVYEASDKIVGMVRQKCIGHAGNSVESKAYFLKLLGDHYRYMAEVAVPKQLPLAQDNATAYYKKAWEAIENSELHPCNETKLGTAMNYSVFLTDRLGRQDQAVQMCE